MHQGTVKFMSIVKEFSKMLSSIPHDQAFTQLLITQIVTFYDKCFGWYKGKRSYCSRFYRSLRANSI